jgi:hypothetical protein
MPWSGPTLKKLDRSKRLYRLLPFRVGKAFTGGISPKLPLWSELSLQGDSRLTPGFAEHIFPVAPSFVSYGGLPR